MFKFEVKFVNLSHQNPHLENAKSVTDDRTRSLASFAAASSDVKILRLIVLHSNLKSNL